MVTYKDTKTPSLFTQFSLYHHPSGHWLTEGDGGNYYSPPKPQPEAPAQSTQSPQSTSVTSLVGACIQQILDCYKQGWSNFGGAWSIYWNPNATMSQRMDAGFYMGTWGDMHILAAAGGIIILRQGVIMIITPLITDNPDGVMVSIGNYAKGVNDYIATAEENGFTVYNPGKFTGLLKVTNLLQSTNDFFTENQIDEAKSFVTTILSDVHPGLDAEIVKLINSGYTQIVGDWTGFSSVFQPPAIPPIP